ncbi:MAG: hypothetical protein A2516_09145 [Alphaproteobacteria bacterium RIFOXYD12_FULL_60_8]|nr:MAG: hypothetical protein A2516_09145 [Alphaproteobacteria bacterium RIFOXYD12_FULL_60_8]
MTRLGKISPWVIAALLVLGGPVWAQTPAPAPAPSAAARSDPDKEILILPGSPVWAKVQGARGQDQDLTRYVLKGESEAAWSEMLTVQIATPSKLTPRDLAERLFGSAGECTTSQTRGPDVSTLNGYQAALYRVACSGPKTPPGMKGLPAWLKQHQVSVTKVFWTPAKTYIITRVWHGDAITPTHPDQRVKEWRDFFDGVQICAPANLKRSCQAWGVLSRAESRVLPPVASGPSACEALDSLTVKPLRPDAFGTTRVLIVKAGALPFFSEPRGDALATEALKALRLDQMVRVDVGLEPSVRSSVEADQRRARAESLMLRRFLVENGVNPKNISIALNSGCMWD